MKSDITGIHYHTGKPVAIEIVDGFIDRIVEIDQAGYEISDGVFVAPGLIDNQVNGYNRIGFSRSDLGLEGVQSVTKALWKFGITTYLPTLITGPKTRLVENLSLLSTALNDSQIAASIPGFHLEGPYISPESGYRGAHNSEWIRPPDWGEFLKLNEAAGERILQVTIAPEVDGAMEFIERGVEHGIVVGIGHHNADAEVITDAVDRGAVISTHLGNGCATMIHRHDNPIWPQLADDRLMASVIVDGFHLCSDELRVFYKVKGPERLVIVSDITELAGLPPGEYPWNGETIVMTPDGMIRYPKQNVLAGASSPLNRNVRNMMKFTGCSLGHAIRMASTVPATLNRLDDRGDIQQGKRADLIVFRVGDDELEIQKTLIAGREVYSVDRG